MSLKLRTSNTLDLPALYYLALEHAVETNIQFDCDQVYTSVKHWLPNCLVAELDGKVVGVIAFTDQTNPWHGDLERWISHWFVSKEHRGRIGLELLKETNTNYLTLPTNSKAPKGYKAKAIIYERI